MSVLEIRDKTLENIGYLCKLATQNSTIEVTVFNKTKSTLLDAAAPDNLKVIETPKESLYQTMARLRIGDDSHVIWLNDDDDFHFFDLSDLSKLEKLELKVPLMKLVTSSGSRELFTHDLIKAKSSTERYVAYWKNPVTLIFGVMPGKIFNTWTNYLEAIPVHLPYLDTQLNVLLCLSTKVTATDAYIYNYGGHNWENYDVQMQNLRRHAKFLHLDEESALSFDHARKIDDLASCRFARKRGLKGTRKLEKRLLSQFTPIQGLGKNLLLRNLGTRSMRRQHIQKIPYPCHQNEFNQKLPLKLREILTGVRTLRHSKHLASALAEPGVARAMHLPQELIDFWVRTLRE
jgi:hypothetical protein